MTEKHFTLAEILDTAIRVERNASAFYGKAAAKAPDTEMKQRLQALADMEKEHEQTFTQMRDSLSTGENAPLIDKGNEMYSLIENGQKLYGYEGKAGPDTELSGSEDKQQLLRYALDAEEHTVELYSAIKQYSDSDEDKQKIDKVIREEQKHIATIKELIA